jgi:hypothetical protein
LQRDSLCAKILLQKHVALWTVNIRPGLSQHRESVCLLGYSWMVVF